MGVCCYSLTQIFTEKNSSVQLNHSVNSWILPSSRGPQVSLTTYDTGQCVWRICCWVQWQLYKRPLTCSVLVPNSAEHQEQFETSLPFQSFSWDEAVFCIYGGRHEWYNHWPTRSYLMPWRRCLQLFKQSGFITMGLKILENSSKWRV